MKELDPFVLLSVLEEMLGILLWPLVTIVVLGTLAFIILLLTEHGIVASRLVRSQTLGLLGGPFAFILMARISSSGFTDAGGPADWFLIALVFGLGVIGATIIFYTVGGWWAVYRRAEVRPGTNGTEATNTTPALALGPPHHAPTPTNSLS